MIRLFPLALLAISSPALAQMGPPSGGQRDTDTHQLGTAQPNPTIMVEPAGMAIAAWDADGDGRTTIAELNAGVARSFAAIDTSGGRGFGYIGYGDWSKRWLGDANALPSPFEVDANHDNMITLAELQAQFAKFFARFDGDKDGAVTRAELLTIRAARFGEGMGRPGGRGRDGGGGGRRGRGRGGMPGE